MKQLTQGMYGGEFESKPDGLFALRTGQMRSRNKFTHNSGWYNADGEKLGFGDLAVQDFVRIMEGLNEGELFVILGEHDSFWNFVTRLGWTGPEAQVRPTAEIPGSEYVAEHAMYIIAKGEVNQIREFDLTEKTTECYGLQMTVISREEARAKIFAARTTK